MKPRLVHIARTLDHGGIETNIYTTLTWLRHEFLVSLVCLFDRGRLAEKLERSGIPVVLFRFKNRWSPPSLWRLVRYLKMEGADIVQTHHYGPNVTGIAAATLARVPVRIATVHEMEQWRNPRRIRTDRVLMPWRDAVFCVSEPVSRMYRLTTGCPPEKCRVIPNGVDLSRFPGTRPRAEVLGELEIPPSSRVVGAVARLVPQKNLDLFLEMAARISRSREDVFFLLVGEGELQEELAQTAKMLGLAERTRFTGYRKDVADVISSLDCLVLTSDTEGFGIVLLEGMACGVPVVATDAGGVRDVLQDGEQGFLVKRGDAEGLARAVLEVLGDSGLARKLSVRGKERAREFGLDSVVPRLAETYRELLRAKRVRVEDAYPVPGGSR